MFKKCLFLILLLPLFYKAAEFPPQPQSYVTDRSALLTLDEQQKLNLKLKGIEDRTSNQFFIYITDSLRGRDMSQLCQEIFHSWKIGRTKNNGVLIAIFLKDHKFRIHTGYGLEGALPDLATKRIQEEVMVPEFKSGNYFSGLDKGLDEISRLVANEFTPISETDNSWPWWIIAFMVNATLLLLFLFLYFFGKSNYEGNKKEILFWGIFVCFFPVLGSIVTLVLIGALCGLNYKRMTNKMSAYNRLTNLRSKSTNSDNDSSFIVTTNTSQSNNSISSLDFLSSGNDFSSSSDSSGSSFDGGGGGDSGGGGSDSSW